MHFGGTEIIHEFGQIQQTVLALIFWGEGEDVERFYFDTFKMNCFDIWF